MTYYTTIGDMQVRVAYIAIGVYMIFCLSALCISCLCFREKTAMNILKHAPNIDADNYDPSAFNADININMNDDHHRNHSKQLASEIDLANKLRSKRAKTEIQMMHLEPKAVPATNHTNHNIVFSEGIHEDMLVALDIMASDDGTAPQMEQNGSKSMRLEDIPVSPISAASSDDKKKFEHQRLILEDDLPKKHNEVRVIVEEDDDDEEESSFRHFVHKWNKLWLYLPILFHFWDIATDLAVLCDWIPNCDWQNPLVIDANINTFYFIVGSIFFQLLYRTVSGYRYAVHFNTCGGILQFLDIMLFFETYSSMNCKKGNATLQLRWIRKMESVLESAPQAFLQLVYVLRTKHIPHIVQISLLFSVLSITSSVVRSDEWKIRRDTNANKICPPNWRFIVRCIFRLLEVTTRLLIMALLSEISILLVAAIFFVELIFYFIMYCDELLGNDLGNVAEILIVHPNLSLRVRSKHIKESIIGLISRYLCCWNIIARLHKQLKDNVVSIHYIHRLLESVLQLSVFMVYELVMESESNSFVNIMFVVALFGMFCVPFLYLICYRWFIIGAGGDGLEMNVFGFLYHAHCEDDMTQFMRYVFRVKSCVNTPNKFNRTPLMEAVLLHNYDICKFLCSMTKYIDLSITDGEPHHKQVIHYVAEVGDDRFLQLILNVTTKYVDAAYGEYCKNALIICSEMGYMQCVELLLQNGANVNYQDQMGRTALHYAIFGESIAVKLETKKEYTLIIRQILARKPNVTLCDKKRKWNALFQAIGCGSLAIHSIVDLVMNINEDALNTFDINGDSALHVAIRYNRFNVLKYLLNNTKYANIDINHRNKENETALELTINLNHIKCLQCLIEYNDCPKIEMKALILCVKGNKPQMVKILIEQFNVDTNFADQNGMTPLRWAVFKGSELITKLLLIGGARDDLDEFGQNIVFYAASNDHIHILQLLHKAHADFCVVNFEGQTASDKTNNKMTLSFIYRVRNIQLQT